MATAKLKSGWAIMDLKARRRYVPRLWATEIEARFELQELLEPYPKKDPWRQRLTLKLVEKRGRKPE